MAVACPEFGDTCLLCVPGRERCEEAVQDGANRLLALAQEDACEARAALGRYFAVSTTALGLLPEHAPILMRKATERAEEMVKTMKSAQ